MRTQIVILGNVATTKKCVEFGIEIGKCAIVYAISI